MDPSNSARSEDVASHNPLPSSNSGDKMAVLHWQEINFDKIERPYVRPARKNQNCIADFIIK